MKYIFIPNYEKMIFFLNLLKAVKDDKFFLLTNDILVYIYIKVFYSKYKILFILTNVSLNYQNDVPTLTAKEKKILNWEIKVYSSKPECITRKFHKIKNRFAEIIQDGSIGICWSGNDTCSLAFSEVINEKSGKTFYCEITNFPLSVYIDSEGVNYYSSIRKQYETLLDKNMTHNNEYKEKLRYKKSMMKKLPQAGISIIKKIDNIITKLFSYRNACHQKVINENMVNINLNRMNQVDGSLIKILIPLQVSIDTQLHVFSPFESPAEFILFVLERIDNSVNIDFKLHPAENKKYNKVLLDQINELSIKFNNIKLVHSVDINNYDAIVTINSTFGIDALLNDVRVITFGQSLYSNFDFVWTYDYKENFNIRYIIENYDSIVKKDRFNLFAQVLLDNFYDMNYFADNLDKDIPIELFEKSLCKLKNRLK